MAYGLRQKFPFLQKFFAVLCLVLFPFFLLKVTLNSYYSLKKTETHRQLLDQARKKLIQLSEMADGARYFHLLFVANLEKIPSGSDQLQKLSKRLKSLKNRFPGELEFVVWNDNNQLNRELTDNPGFVVFLNRLNLFFQDLQKLVIDLFPGELLVTSELKKQVRSFRRLVGPFIPAVKIAASFVPTSKKKCFQMHAKGKRAYGWYTRQPGYSIFAYISHRLINSMAGAKELCHKNNRKGDDLKILLLQEEQEKIFPLVSEKLKNQIQINIGKLDQLVPPELIESEGLHFSFQNLRPGWWGIVFTDIGHLRKIDQMPNLLLFRIGAVLIFFIFVLRCFFMVNDNPFASIRFKLLAVFVYTVAIPMMIFSTVGFEYFSQRIEKTESDFKIRLIQTLSSIDMRFENYLHRQAEKLNSRVDRFIRNEKDLTVNSKKWIKLGEELKNTFKATAFLLIDAQGNDVYNRHYSKDYVDASFPKSLGAELLDLLNDRPVSKIKNPKVMVEPSMLSFKKTRKKINLLALVERQFFFYISDLQLKSKFHSELCLQIYWDLRSLQSEFFKEIEQDFSSNKYLLPMLYFGDTGAILPKQSQSSELVNFLKKVDIGGAQSERIKFKARDYLAAGFRGSFMENSVIAVLFDYSLLAIADLELKKTISGLLFLALIFSLSLYLILSHQILLPVEKLAVGVEKVGQLDFNYRIKLESENEFGRLANSINHTLENLGELEIAKVVQEALLPESGIDNYSFRVIGTTLSMNKLGGDYYDFFVEENGDVVLFMADAAGHGIQAALMMAMAKSVLLIDDQKNRSDEELMNNLNQTFFHLRESAIKTMMTGQLVRIGKEGAKLYNAGHCYPFVLEPESQAITEISQGSFPFGYSKKRTFSPVEFSFAAGSFLMMITDGIIESRNNSGETLGIEGFKNFIRTSYDSDPEIFFSKLLEMIKSWQPTQEDDLTIVLVCRKK
ncbi:MAG: SpoIIE family protein phosphatase [Candidatus Rifleibacteriota bacterium]